MGKCTKGYQTRVNAVEPQDHKWPYSNPLSVARDKYIVGITVFYSVSHSTSTCSKKQLFTQFLSGLKTTQRKITFVTAQL